MKTVLKSPQSVFLRLLLFLSLASITCATFATPAPNPTATWPAEVDSPRRFDLLGQWKIVNGGAWGGATLTFSDDGSFSVTGGLQEKEANGEFVFTSENTIMFNLSDYQGSATLEFEGRNKISMTVTTSKGPLGEIYSAERIK